MMTDSMYEALKRSIEARNNDPKRMQDWLDDFAERMESSYGVGEDCDYGDPV